MSPNAGDPGDRLAASAVRPGAPSPRCFLAAGGGLPARPLALGPPDHPSPNFPTGAAQGSLARGASPAGGGPQEPSETPGMSEGEAGGAMDPGTPRPCAPLPSQSASPLSEGGGGERPEYYFTRAKTEA